jgi:hypothetical protein
MGNKQFETSNLMTKNNNKDYYIYYIDIIHAEFQGIDTYCKYVADRRVKVDKFTTIIEETDTYVIFEFNYDETPRRLKGFKTKELALHHLQKDLK